MICLQNFTWSVFKIYSIFFHIYMFTEKHLHDIYMIIENLQKSKNHLSKLLQ